MEESHPSFRLLVVVRISRPSNGILPQGYGIHQIPLHVELSDLRGEQEVGVGIVRLQGRVIFEGIDLSAGGGLCRRRRSAHEDIPVGLSRECGAEVIEQR